MSEADFIDLLVRALSAGWITEEEAQQLVRLYVAGDLDDALFALDLSAAVEIPTEAQLRAFRVLFAELERDEAQDAFIRLVAALAPRAATNVAVWQEAFRRYIAAYILHQAESARSGELSGEDRAALADVVQFQLAYLAGFANQVSVQALLQRPMSTARIAARSGLYAGAGRAAWFSSHEAELEDGWVCYYEAIDDAGTCSPCAEAERLGPYLPGQGPRPGDVCKGRGYCRCRRVYRYEPAVAARLRGQ